MAYLYETHMHTAEGSGCGRNSAREQVMAYKNRGYAGIIITDHFINGYSTCPRGKRLSWEAKMRYVEAGYKAAKKAAKDLDFSVFFGWEFTIRGSDFLTYGLDFDFLLSQPNLDTCKIEEYSQIVRENGGFLAQAHPYRDKPYIEYRFPVGAQFVDAVEVYNASDDEHGYDRVNKQAEEFAAKHNLPTQAGGDSHSTNDKASGVSLKHKAESIFDIIAAIKAKDVELII